MKKLIIVTTLCLCGIANHAFANTVTLKIATAAPEASTWVKAMRESAAEIKERTAGRVVIKYYVGGIQGSDKQVLRKIKIRNLHGGAFTPSALAEQYPDINLYSLPMTFASEDEATYVRQRMDTRLADGLEERGFVTFGFASTGFAMVMSNVPVSSVADLKGKKVWVPEGDYVSYETMKALSVSPQPLPLTDVLVGLQTRLIDIAPVSAIGALFLQWHTRVKYVTDFPLVYTMGFMAVDKAAFGKIEPADQAIVKNVMSQMYAEFDQRSAKDNAEAYAALLNTGIEKVVPAPSAIDELQRKMATSNRQLAEQGAVSLDLYEEMLTFVDEYRNGKGAVEQSAEMSSVAAD